MGKKKVFIETYGCQMNIADSELMYGILADSGMQKCDTHDEADVILLNTCAVREKAEERIFGRLSQLLPLKRARPKLRFGVAGCMAEHLRESILKRAPYVDIIIGPDAYRRLPQMLDASDFDPAIDVRLDKREVYEGLSPAKAEGVEGWITIQRGCDKFCTFCIVPFVRGRERGVPPREILRQARLMAEQGVSQVTLLGQTVNSYAYEGVDFADLLRTVAQIDGIERVRFTSPYPRDFNAKLIETIAEVSEVCKYVHLPLQSASNPILEAMRRQHTIEEYHAIVEALRKASPEIAISTDIIAGFPDETDEDHRRTVEYMAQVRYDFAFMFAYSERDGTAASKKIPDTVPDTVKKRRLAEIIKQQERIGKEIFTSRIGSRQIVLAKGTSRKSNAELVGNTDDFKTTVFARENFRAGDIVEVEVVSASSHTLRAKPIRLVTPSRLPVDLINKLMPAA